MPARRLYTFLWWIALPFVMLRLVWRGRREPGYRKHMGERFGQYGLKLSTPVIWVHAVSVGETRAAEPLIRGIRSAWPDHSVLLTHTTPAGRAAAASLFGSDPLVHSVYLPYDFPGPVGRFLGHFRPRVGVIMETELWPNLLLSCRERGIPTLLANARLSERSAARYRRWSGFAAQTVGALTAIAAQSEDDARRLRGLGSAVVEVTGNIKFDVEAPAQAIEIGRRFRELLRERPVLVSASTRAGEEALILDAFVRLAPPEVLLVLVPRHPQRFDEVARLVEARGLSYRRRSGDGALPADARVWLGDSMGEMFAYYTAADVALIGGSWLRYGGQNLIEPCAVGTPVIVGPHTEDFLRVAELAIDCGAARRAKDAGDAVAIALALLADDDSRERMGAAGREFVAGHRGAAANTLTILWGILDR